MSQIHFEIYGQGHPVVLIHGWAMHTGVWRDFARQLAVGCQTICVDLPGHGRSDAVYPFTVGRVVDALVEVLPVAEFSVLGWSMGALFAIDMAYRYPDRVQSLWVLAGSPKFVAGEDWPGVAAEVLDAFAMQLAGDVRLTLMRFLALQVNSLPDAKTLLISMKQAMQECATPAVEVLQAGLDLLKNSDMRGSFAGLLCPVCVILGDRDRLIPLESGLAMQKLKSEVSVQVLESAGHLPFLSHSRQVIDSVWAAL